MKIKSLVAALFFVLVLPMTFTLSDRYARVSHFVALGQTLDCSHSGAQNCGSPSPSLMMEPSRHHSQSGPAPSNTSIPSDFGAGAGLLALGLALVTWLRLR
ncbi:MAG TPA: hypothetical protein VEZ90_06865 [Blastocatellia bacterium]|nr:hypothetical protein [Blastocatellia bacterium]